MTFLCSPCGLSPTRPGRQALPIKSKVSNNVRYEVEKLIYPLSSLVTLIAKICVYHNFQVAELGGTLGLFVGFSFLGVFDALVSISCSAVNIFNRGLLLSGNKSI